VYPLTNAQHSPTAYTIDPKEHFHAWRHAESRGWELIGAFHSHPGGPPLPSATDLALAAEPDWAYLIVHDRSIRGFMIHGRKAEEIELRYLPANTGRQAGS
ncbi:MAG: M67 family metallopeptidase, partial [Acidimicrobiia bacterium]